MSYIAREAPKWLQTMQIECTNRLVYKADMLLQIVGPALVFFLIKYQLWSSIFSLKGIDLIAGYSLEAMLEYQAWVLLVGFISQSYNSRNLADDIRLGRISSYLVYPFEFWKFHTASFLGFQAVQLFIVILTTVVLFSLGMLPSLSLGSFFIALIYSLFVGVVWFAVYFTIGLLAFWIEETWTLRVTFAMSAQFLSGAIIPIEFFPKFAQSILDYLPFKYMTYVPVKVFMGEYEQNLTNAFLILLLWFFIIFIIARFVWKKGIRLYSAAGM